MVKIISNVQQRKTLEQILQDVTEENRSVQMNFVALACDNLGIEPPYPGNVWTRFDNPYLVGNKVDQMRVSAALGAIKKESGGRAKWPGNGVRVDFSRLYNDGQLTNLS